MKKPKRSTLLLAPAVTSVAYWLIGTLMGHHPDGALLGFSGTMFAVWAATSNGKK